MTDDEALEQVGPEASADPMEASILSDEEVRRRDEPAADDGATGVPPPPQPRKDPTDAPDLFGSVLGRVSRHRLAGWVALVVVAVAVVLLAVLSLDHVSPVLGRCIGGVLVLGSIWTAIRVLPSADDRWRATSLLLGLTIIGLMLLADPDRWMEPIGWIIGSVMIISGVRMLLENWGSGQHGGTAVAAGVVLIVLGAVAALTFDSIFEAGVVVIALLAVASGAVGIAARSGYARVAPRSRRNRPILIRWIDGKSQATESRNAVLDTVFFEGADAPAELGRFFLMMLFASSISAAGVLSDSTAVVIGAMLIAPLITPMMGMGLALVAGWPNRLGRSSLIVIAGSASAVATAWLLTIVTDVAVDLETNSQIVSRSSPGTIDLVIAVGAGAAGAYALSRKEVSASLPGVAVSIALVPPLSVVGVILQSDDWRQASGPLLLFLTNLVAIILAGGAVFLLTGVVPLHRFAEHQHRVRTAIVAVAALAVVVVGGLVLNGRQITADARDVELSRTVVADWLGDDSQFGVVTVEVDADDVSVVLTGPGTPPSPDRLAVDLADELGREVVLDLQWVPRERVVVPSG